MTRYIDCLVNNEYVKGAEVPIGAAGSHDDVLLRFTFNEMWDGLTKKITWTDAYGENPTLTILTQDMIVDEKYCVPVPIEAKKYPGMMAMSIKGATVDEHTLTATVNRTTWEASTLGGTSGIFTFKYDEDSWTYNSTDVTLSTYGITATGTPISGDLLYVTRTTTAVTIEASPYHPELRATISAKAEFEVLESTWDDDAEESEEPSSSQYTQLQTEINYIKNTAPYIGTNGDWYVWNNTTGTYVDTEVSATGATGNGISSIAKTSTSGLVDTYTITYTDGTTTTYTVTNGAKGDTGSKGDTGNGISSITKTSSSGLVDTYTITFTDGTTTTYTVTNGSSGGAIDVIKVQGETQTITNKTVDLNVITKITATGGLQSSTSSGQASIELDSASVASLAKADTALQSVPNLDASKITTGTFADARIASASTWNAKASKSTLFTKNLSSSGWSSSQQTITFSSGELPISGYAYTVSPASASFTAYGEAQIYADDVTTADTMVFHCTTTPTADLTVVILKTEVS